MEDRPSPPPLPPRSISNEASPEAPEAPLEAPLDGPPDGASVLLSILDHSGDFRGYISEDGECFNKFGKTSGHINRGENTAGSADEVSSI